MNVGIDARMFGPRVGGGGLGRYVEQLVANLAASGGTNRYVLWLMRENFDAPAASPRLEKRLADIRWYTLREQLMLASVMDAAKCDLIHFPHWNVPLFLRTPFVVTIHDLILLEEPRSARATTRHPLLYALKYAAYRAVLAHAVRKSRAIIAVSEYTKRSILRHFPDVAPEKITVIYEGVTDFPSRTPDTGHRTPASPYFLHVGNAYPHKNLESLLHAFSLFVRTNPEVRLVLCGARDAFAERLLREAAEIGIPRENLVFVQNPDDAELADLYRHASLYLFPSRAEGFGLPGLEAMREGVPVAAARAGSLPEIYGDAAMYFAPDDLEAMVSAMESALTDEPLRRALRARGRDRVARYSWARAAEETLKVYALAAA